MSAIHASQAVELVRSLLKQTRVEYDYVCSPLYNTVRREAHTPVTQWIRLSVSTCFFQESICSPCGWYGSKVSEARRRRVAVARVGQARHQTRGLCGFPAFKLACHCSPEPQARQSREREREKLCLHLVLNLPHRLCCHQHMHRNGLQRVVEVRHAP